ncbi:MAG: hypothetical protein K9K67_08045 [Bacteriovoracaceae bacterium]|nr:hypothetical protein [Bacteriovoracaceae bacterium]
MFKPRFLLVLIFWCSLANGQDCISHRVMMGAAPDNSLEGIDIAVSKAVDGVEFDIQFTKDGVPLLYHDSRLGEGLSGELCPRGQKIKKVNFKEIDQFCFLENGENLPLLGEALSHLSSFKGHLFVDLKQIPSEQFFKVMEKSGLINYPKLRFLSFKKRALRPLKKRWPFTKGILLSRFIPRGLFYNGVALNKRLSLVTPLFGFLGKETGLWTMNSEEQIGKARKKGVDFIITDEYELCELKTL